MKARPTLHFPVLIRLLLSSAIVFTSVTFTAQTDTTEINVDALDSIYIDEVEGWKGRSKVLHAEPLFIDLIRDLGARKGEKEWNLGTGITDNNKYADYSALIEYEWAPADRLGLEVELPFSFYYDSPGNRNGDTIPKSNLNSLKLATQFSFFVSEKAKTSFALGYIHEFEIGEITDYSRALVFSGNVYNPFVVAAKRWGQNFHTLIYSGPLIFQHFGASSVHSIWQMNSSFHYMIDGTRNFVGIEFNKQHDGHDFDMTIRPQMRLGISDNLLVGIVTGIPIARESQRFSTFLRLIYEPRHKQKH